MAGFTYRLELTDGRPADPPVLRTAVPTWRAATRSRLAVGHFASSRFETTMQINLRRWWLKTVPNGQ
jgi:hypothetical protein